MSLDIQHLRGGGNPQHPSSINKPLPILFQRLKTRVCRERCEDHRVSIQTYSKGLVKKKNFELTEDNYKTIKYKTFYTFIILMFIYAYSIRRIHIYFTCFVSFFVIKIVIFILTIFATARYYRRQRQFFGHVRVNVDTEPTAPTTRCLHLYADRLSIYLLKYLINVFVCLFFFLIQHLHHRLQFVPLRTAAAHRCFTFDSIHDTTARSLIYRKPYENNNVIIR